MPEILQAKNLSRTSKSRVLLGGVSLGIGPGDRISLVGHAGSGKSLLLRAVALLDPVDSGEILWHGRTVLPQEIPRFRSRIAYLPQKPALWGTTVEDCFEAPFGLRQHRGKAYNPDEIQARLCAFGRDKTFLRQSTGRLSGGESQIVALLRTLQFDPEVLLLDEPTAALDAASASQVEALVLNWQAADPARAYIWVSHQQELAQRVGRRLLVMEAGRLKQVER